MTNHTASDTVLRRHPIQGALWGVPLGAGIALHLLGFGVIPFGAWPLLAAPVAGAIFMGILWGAFGPARATKGLTSPERRSTSKAAAERRSAAEVRATQLLAARHANEELHGIAAANDDNAMQAALHEAEKDVDGVPTRTKRGQNKPSKAAAAERSRASATTPEPQSPSDQVEVTSQAVIDLASPAPTADTSTTDAALIQQPLAATAEAQPVPASPPLSLPDPGEPEVAATPAQVSAPVATPTPTDPPLSLTDLAEPEVEPVEQPDVAQVIAPAGAMTAESAPAPAIASNAPTQDASAATAPLLQESVAAPTPPPATLPDVTTTQDLTPFENSPLPSDADEERAAADKLEAQLEAALREAVAVTMGSR